jgi:hypothetical protein
MMESSALLLTFVIVLFLPWLLNRLVRRIQIHQEIEPMLNAPSSRLICGALTLFGCTWPRRVNRA